MAEPCCPCKQIRTLLSWKQEERRNFEVGKMESVEVKGRGSGVHAFNLSKSEAKSSEGSRKFRRAEEIQEYSHSKEDKKSATCSKEGVVKII